MELLRLEKPGDEKFFAPQVIGGVGAIWLLLSLALDAALAPDQYSECMKELGRLQLKEGHVGSHVVPNLQADIEEKIAACRALKPEGKR